MKRFVVATAVLAMVITLGSSGVAQAGGRHHIRPGGVWTITVVQCEVLTFGSGHTFTGETSFGDAGTYTGGRNKLKETFTTGPNVGGVFKGRWSKTNQDYEGTYTYQGDTGPATLTPGSNPNC